MNQFGEPAKSPWDADGVPQWLNSLDSWKQMIRLILGTLQLEVHDKPHEIRAAASMVVMFCRENLWPTDDRNTQDKVLGLAARQLSQVKHLFETKARENPKLQSNPKFRSLLVSIDQEIRILEARQSDPKPVMPDSPPATWGNFWVESQE